MNKIYFRLDSKPKNIIDLLKDGYNGFNSTLLHEFKPTYKDEGLTKCECHAARRSFGDLLIICKTYFPKTQRKDLAKAIMKLNKQIGLRASYCNTIDKLVFLKQNNRHIPIDYYMNGYRSLRGKGTVSFSEFVKLAKQK